MSRGADQAPRPTRRPPSGPDTERCRARCGDMAVPARSHLRANAYGPGVRSAAAGPVAGSPDLFRSPPGVCCTPAPRRRPPAAHRPRAQDESCLSTCFTTHSRIEPCARPVERRSISARKPKLERVGPGDHWRTVLADETEVPDFRTYTHLYMGTPIYGDSREPAHDFRSLAAQGRGLRYGRRHPRAEESRMAFPSMRRWDRRHHRDPCGTGCRARAPGWALAAPRGPVTRLSAAYALVRQSLRSGRR